MIGAMKGSLLQRSIDAFREGGLENFGRRSTVFFRRRFFRSLAPFQQIQAEVEPLNLSAEVVAGCMQKARVRVQNRSKIIWNPSGSHHPGFAVGATILGDHGPVYDVHTAIPGDLTPGRSCDVELLLEIPRKPGRYVLRLDIVRENCYWFAEIGRAPVEMSFEVKPHSIALLSKRVPALDVTLDITNKCPLKCIQCRKTYFETFDEQQDMNFELFRKIASEVFPHAYSVMLSSAGEPLMSRNLFDAVEMTKAQGYNRIRIGSDFDKVVKNIAYLTEVKKKRGSRTPMLRFNFVLMKSNIQDLPAFIDLAAKLGAEEVLSQHMVIFVGQMKNEALLFDKAQSNACIGEARKRAAAHHIRFYHPPLFTDSTDASPEAKDMTDGKIWMQEDAFDFERKTHPVVNDGMQLCTDPWRKIYVDWQGQVFPCCVWKEAPLGDLRRQSFLEIWESDRYRRLREGLTTGNLGKSCAECSVITGGDVNSERSYFFAQQQ
jgi:radical SAM protein with 4Fe4S-binding SPASM domain